MKSTKHGLGPGSITSAGTFSLSSVQTSLHNKKVSAISNIQNQFPENKIRGETSTLQLIDALHQRIKDARERREHESFLKNGRQNGPLNEVVPANRNALLIKYRPQSSQGMYLRQDGPKEKLITAQYKQKGIPSYKKDAMKLIVHKLQRYMIDVIKQIERVGVDNQIQKQREDLASYLADDSKHTQVDRQFPTLVFEIPDDLFQTEQHQQPHIVLNQKLGKIRPLYDTPQESPVKENAYIQKQEPALNIPRQLIGVLEEVKETSGIEVMEQESSMMVEELTDVQAFDQSPRLLFGQKQIKDSTSSKMIMISQERGFKSFLDQKTTPDKSTTSIPLSNTKVMINRKKYNKSDLPLQIAPLAANFRLHNPSEVSFSDNQGAGASYHLKGTSSVFTIKSQSMSPEFKQKNSRQLQLVNQNKFYAQSPNRQIQPPINIIDKLKSIVQEFDIQTATQKFDSSDHKRSKIEDIRRKIQMRTNTILEQQKQSNLQIVKQNSPAQKAFINSHKRGTDQELQVSFESPAKSRIVSSERVRPLLDALNQAYQKKVAMGLMSLIKYQLDIQKVRYILKIFNKRHIRRSFNQFKINSKKVQSAKQITRILSKKHQQIILRIIDTNFIQWKFKTQALIQKEIQILKRDSIIRIVSTCEQIKIKNTVNSFTCIKMRSEEAKSQQKLAKYSQALSDLQNLFKTHDYEQKHQAFLQTKILAASIMKQLSLQRLVTIIDNYYQTKVQSSFKALLMNYLHESVRIKNQLELQQLQDMQRAKLQGFSFIGMVIHEQTLMTLRESFHQIIEVGIQKHQKMEILLKLTQIIEKYYYRKMYNAFAANLKLSIVKSKQLTFQKWRTVAKQSRGFRNLNIVYGKIIMQQAFKIMKHAYKFNKSVKNLDRIQTQYLLKGGFNRLRKHQKNSILKLQSVLKLHAVTNSHEKSKMFNCLKLWHQWSHFQKQKHLKITFASKSLQSLFNNKNKLVKLEAFQCLLDLCINLHNQSQATEALAIKLDRLFHKINLKNLQIGFQELKEQFIKEKNQQQMILTLRKVTATNQIIELFEQYRVDREVFLIWKSQYLNQKQVQVGLGIIKSVITPHLSQCFSQIKKCKIQEEAKTAKTANIFKRLIPPSPRDNSQRQTLAKRTIYSSFSHSASRSSSNNESRRGASNIPRNGTLLATSHDDSQPITLIKHNSNPFSNTNSSDESSNKGSRNGSVQQKSNMRYSKCDQNDYGDELCDEPPELMFGAVPQQTVLNESLGYRSSSMQLVEKSGEDEISNGSQLSNEENVNQQSRISHQIDEDSEQREEEEEISIYEVITQKKSILSPQSYGNNERSITGMVPFKIMDNIKKPMFHINTLDSQGSRDYSQSFQSRQKLSQFITNNQNYNNNSQSSTRFYTNDAFKALLQERPNSCQTYYCSDKLQQRVINLDNIEKGMMLIKNYKLREALTEIIMFSFSPQGQLQYEKNLALRRLEKLAQAVEIRKKAVSREQIKKDRVMQQWKRQDYHQIYAKLKGFQENYDDLYDVDYQQQ